MNERILSEILRYLSWVDICYLVPSFKVIAETLVDLVFVFVLSFMTVSSPNMLVNFVFC